jgi:hypothetical protein
MITVSATVKPGSVARFADDIVIVLKLETLATFRPQQGCANPFSSL